jgi:hypothetical protein
MTLPFHFTPAIQLGISSPAPMDSDAGGLCLVLGNDSGNYPWDIHVGNRRFSLLSLAQARWP